MLEILLVVAILGLLLAAVMMTFNQYMPRFHLRGTTDQVTQLITKARMTAIKRGVTTVVAADFADRSIQAFAEINGDPANPNDPLALYLVYDPTLGDNADRTDFEIGYIRLPGTDEFGIQFGEPIGGVASIDTIVGFTIVPSDPMGNPVLIFSPNGAIGAPGSFRFIDAKGMNSLEAAVTTIAGSIEIRKFLFLGDAPGVEGYYPEGNLYFDHETTGKNLWVWY